ncbi:pyocin knob domain-containing protein [Pasteurella atlantica]|uniref:pyocin knob domain-containing protein n=1 Tax=Pasteurella atlantica TaxID=2827233 RepID=UPI002755FE1D|nr:pyocin knob domain-containing protein [Pasteurella atlantica]MDP8181558.1 pyocin knob domain-containing protein [Pasteurella atlantica]MDP8196032.1 pyocin knob domain-containing protein [Pasteurella atlantica]
MKEKLENIESNDGEFHDGNPASGEQGTIVTAKWLNNVQKVLQSFGDEFAYLLKQVKDVPNNAKNTQIYDALMSIFNREITQKKSSSVTSTSEDTIATSKAAKTAYDKAVTAQNTANTKVSQSNISNSVSSTSQTTVGSSRAVKIAYDRGTTALNKAVSAENIANHKIDNSKKSSSVTSNSEDDVATPKSVKTAYDKAVTAQNTANGKVSKSGDTMTGDLFINISKVLTEDDFQVKALTSENFNDIWKVGIYHRGRQWGNGDLTVLNYPKNIAGVLFVKGFSETFIHQEYRTNEGELYIRHFANNEWSEWELLNPRTVQNLTQNGWKKLPSGLILQWGYVNNEQGYEHSRRYNFNISFTQNCFGVFITSIDDLKELGHHYANNRHEANYVVSATVKNVNANSFEGWIDDNSGSCEFYWFAIGQ